MTFVVVALLIGGGLGFYGGISYAKKQTSAAAADRQGRFTQGGQVGGRGGMSQAGGGFLAGEIVTKDDTSMTVKTQDGSSKIVFYGGSTTVMKTATGTPSDLHAGETVTIMGTANQDGSVSAQSIQLRPTMSARGQ